MLQQYQELERTLYNSFSTLIQDTSVLRDYTHSILTIFQSCFEKAATSYSCAASPHADAPPATTHKSKVRVWKCSRALTESDQASESRSPVPY